MSIHTVLLPAVADVGCIIFSYAVVSPTRLDHACVRCHIHTTLLAACHFQDRLTAWFVGRGDKDVDDPVGPCEFPICTLPTHAFEAPDGVNRASRLSGRSRKADCFGSACVLSLVWMMNSSEFKHSSHDVVMGDVPEATAFLMALAHHRRGARRAVENPANITNSKHKQLAVIAYRHHPTAVCRCRCSHRQVAAEILQVVGCRSVSRREASSAPG